MIGGTYLDSLGKAFVPKKFRPSMREYLLKAGITQSPYRFFGIMFFVAIFITITTYLGFFFDLIKDISPVGLGVLTFFYFAVGLLGLSAFIIVGIYFYLNIKIYERTKALEEKLPEYLTLLSTNLKGGMSFDKALWSAIKPQFGILSKEITLVSKKVMTGNDVAEALVEFSEKYNSPILKRTINLMISEIESGGKITEVIDRIVANLRKTRQLKAEMAATTVSYMIFIAVIVIVIAPALFALSLQLLNIVIGFTSNLSSSGSGTNLPVSIGQVSIDPNSFRTFSALALGIISVFSSMIISIIEKGDVKGGLKYIPLFLVGSQIFYIIFLNLLSKLFSGITG